jgi:WXXGXW repeat (2 copies)
MKNTLKHSLLCAAFLALSACTTVEPIHAPAQRVVIRDIPAPRVETIPAPPSPSHHWVRGHWYWHEGDWHWAEGHWHTGVVPPMPALVVEEITGAPSPAHYWVKGHWVWRNNEWEWAKGHWAH